MSASKYPKYVYDAQSNPVLVNSEDEEKALQGKHYESPADIPASRDRPKEQPKAPKPAAPPVEDTRSIINEKPLKPGHEHRDRLEQEAERIGLTPKPSKNETNETLQRRIVEFASS
jgi:hypothetical protein